MYHRLINNIEAALGWNGPKLGEFAVGTMPDTDLPARIMEPEDLMELLMRRSVGLPQVRCLRDGRDMHPNLFTTTLQNRRGPDPLAYDPTRIVRILEGAGTADTAGATLVADALQIVDPTIELACRAVGWWTGELARVNGYLTTGTTTGFPLHWDDHDVIIVQLAGTKSWEVREQSRRSPLYRDTVNSQTPPEETIWSGTLRAGQVMHIPRGYWHHATRADLDADGYSFHVTIGLTQRTGIDWLMSVADQARHEELFRADLPSDLADATDAHDLQAHTKRLSEQVGPLVDVHTPAAMLTHRRRVQAPARHLHLGAMWGSHEAAVVAITEFAPEIEVTDTQVIVRAAGKQIACERAAEGPLRMLLSGQPVLLDPSSPETDQRALCELSATLLEEGLCAPMTKALWSGCTDLIPTAN